MARKTRAYTRTPPAKDAGTSPESTTGDVAQLHPDLDAVLDDYRDMRDAASGSSAVKRAAERYLPKPGGFAAQSDSGVAMYDAYRMRAQFPEIFSPTISGMIGIIHATEAKITGLEEGRQLAYLWEKATPDGLPLEILHRRITQEILTVGRVVLLPDVPVDGGEPYIAMYEAETLLNWSETRDFFVLKETLRVRSGYSWQTDIRYRVLELVGGQYTVNMVSEGGKKVPLVEAGVDSIVAGSKEDVGTPEDSRIVPTARGGKTLDAIPIVVAGSRDLSLKPDEIPLAGVARASFAIYRLDADYRHQLFMSGQDTLVFSGLDKADIPEYVGAGVAIALPKEGKAEYVGIGAAGLDAHQKAISDEREVAAAAGARVFDISKRGAESGDALRIRTRASSATLVSVAQSSAAALEQALRNCGRMSGMSETEVAGIVVTPSLDFVDSKMTAQEASTLVDVWQTGAISYQTLYDNLQRGEIASQERTAEEEQELAAMEQSVSVEDDLAGMGEDPETDVTEEDVSDEELAQLFDPELLKDANVG